MIPDFRIEAGGKPAIADIDGDGLLYRSKNEWSPFME